MEDELRNVLDHPALDIKHWNAEIKSIFIKIITVIFGMSKMIETHRLTTRVKGKYGNHYKECVWSNPNVEYGPDTCVCCCVGVAKHTIQLLLKEIVDMPSDE